MAETVQLFVTCLIDSFFPQIGEAMVNVLNRAGARVDFPSAQTCCGQPAFNAGLRSEARPLAMHTIRVFEKTTGAIIIPSGSCAAMMRYGYLELFKDDPAWLERAGALAKRVYKRGAESMQAPAILGFSACTSFLGGIPHKLWKSLSWAALI